MKLANKWTCAAAALSVAALALTGCDQPSDYSVSSQNPEAQSLTVTTLARGIFGHVQSAGDVIRLTIPAEKAHTNSDLNCIYITGGNWVAPFSCNWDQANNPALIPSP